MNNEGFTEVLSTLYMLLVRHLHKLRCTYMFHTLQLLLLSLEPGLSLTFSHISSLSVFFLLLSSSILGVFCAVDSLFGFL